MYVMFCIYILYDTFCMYVLCMYVISIYYVLTYVMFIYICYVLYVYTLDTIYPMFILVICI